MRHQKNKRLDSKDAVDEENRSSERSTHLAWSSHAAGRPDTPTGRTRRGLWTRPPRSCTATRWAAETKTVLANDTTAAAAAHRRKTGRTCLDPGFAARQQRPRARQHETARVRARVEVRQVQRVRGHRSRYAAPHRRNGGVGNFTRARNRNSVTGTMCAPTPCHSVPGRVESIALTVVKTGVHTGDTIPLLLPHPSSSTSPGTI